MQSLNSFLVPLSGVRLRERTPKETWVSVVTFHITVFSMLTLGSFANLHAPMGVGSQII